MRGNNELKVLLADRAGGGQGAPQATVRGLWAGDGQYPGERRQNHRVR